MKNAVGIRIPKLGRIWLTRDQGDARMVAREHLMSNLKAVHYRDGKVLEKYDFGSGLTTQGLALALANEPVSAANSSALKTLAYMTSGTSNTAATAYDYQLGTQAGPVTTSITPTVGVSGDNATLQWVGTITYTTSLAIVEWGLFAGGGLYGVPSGFTNTSTDTFTGTTATPGASQSWTVNAYAGQYIVQVASGTSVIGFITSNSATALTISPGWVDQTSGGGSGSTPSSNTAMTVLPLMADHKIFSTINVVNTDAIQFTYTLTIDSGG